MPRLFDWEYDGDSKLIAVTVDDDGDGLYDFEIVRHGRWEHGMRCSGCGQVDTTKPNYCPNCGAKMDGGAEC